ALELAQARIVTAPRALARRAVTVVLPVGRAPFEIAVLHRRRALGAARRHVVVGVAGGREIAVRIARRRQVARRALRRRHVVVGVAGGREIAVRIAGGRQVARRAPLRRHVTIAIARGREIAVGVARRRQVMGGAPRRRQIAFHQALPRILVSDPSRRRSIGLFRRRRAAMHLPRRLVGWRQGGTGGREARLRHARLPRARRRLVERIGGGLFAGGRDRSADDRAVRAVHANVFGGCDAQRPRQQNQRRKHATDVTHDQLL